MPYLEANDLRFHVQMLSKPQSASGPHAPTARPKVVMIHGLILADLATYYYTIAHSVSQVADTYLYDLRGNGRTEVPRSGYTVRDHVADLRSLVDAWGIDEPIHLVANSFGGAVALAFTDAFPERVASLVMIDGVLDVHLGQAGNSIVDTAIADVRRRDISEARATLQGGMYKAVLAAFGFDEQTIDAWRQRSGSRKQSSVSRIGERLILETSFIDDIRREQPLPDQVLQAIGCPTLAIYGERSDLLGCAHRLARLIPRCELHVVPGCTHEVLSEATPFVRNKAVAWITQVRANCQVPANLLEE